MKSAAVLALAGTAALSVLYGTTSYEILLPFAITFGTAAYHLVVRLLAGGIFRVTMKNRADLSKPCWQVGDREAAFYEKIGVKKLKCSLPTYDDASFDPRHHTWDEIAMASCQAERVHETNVVLSFLPILAGFRFGAFPVFIITSFLAAAFDSLFVIEQRCNRYRIFRLLSKKSGKFSTLKSETLKK